MIIALTIYLLMGLITDEGIISYNRKRRKRTTAKEYLTAVLVAPLWAVVKFVVDKIKRLGGW